MRHLKDTQIRVMIEKSEGRKEELPMKNLTGKILLALSLCMLSFLVPHSFSQAKVLNFDIYDGDMPGDLEDYYDEEKEYVDEEDLYFPGDSGKITAKSSYYFEEIAKVEFVSTDSNIVSVDAEGNYLVKGNGFATIHVTGWDKDGEVILRGGHSFLVGGDMSQTTLSKNSALRKYKEKTTLKIKGYSGKIRWVSTNKKVATVSGKGVIKSKKKTGNILK